MKWNKLLETQIETHIPHNWRKKKELQHFFEVINETYDKSSASFMSMNHNSVNQQLKKEIELKKFLLDRLNEVIVAVEEADNSTHHKTNEILDVVDYLKKQIDQRKKAEKELLTTANRLSALIINIQSGILVEDENRNIALVNQLFCNLFGITISAEELKGMNCAESAEQSKHLFKDSENFMNRIEELLTLRKLAVNDELELADGRFFERDYIPIFVDKEYKGHLWKYRDITGRKKTQIAIEQSELKNRLIMNAALDAIITIDNKGHITFWNPQAEKIFGWKETEILGRKISDTIIPSQFRIAHEKGMQIYTETGTGSVLNKQFEISAINKEGKEFPIELSIVPIEQDGNKFFCSFIRDISQRKHTEKQLRLTSLVASLNRNGVIFTDTTGKIIWSNEGFSTLIGYSSNEIMGKTPLDLMKGEQTSRSVLNEMLAQFYNGNNFNVELICYRKDNSWFWGACNAQAIKNNKGEIELFFAFVEDITNKKHAEEQLRIQEEKYRNIIANMNLGLLEVDKTDKIQFANQSFCNISGYSLDELINKNAAQLFTKGANLDFVHTKTDLRKKGISDAYEIAIKNKTGNVRWWFVSGAPRYNDKGEHIGSIGIHLDITDQKKMEQNLIEAKKQAENSTKAKEIFLANMSHEIRTPMNAILGMSHQLAKTSLDEKQHFYLDTIRSAAENLLVIINDILDLSKIEAGKMHIEKINFIPKRIVGSVMQVLQHKAEEKGLNLINSFCDPDLSSVLIGDPYRLNQILINLVGNAIKFTEKGYVDLSCKVITDNQNIQIIRIKVKDTGIGMEKEFVEKIFEKFNQEDISVGRRYGGTGLGMSICKELINLMDGSIEIKSKKNEGTTVAFTIPFTKGKAEHLPVKETYTVDTQIIGGKKILIVDDNEMNRLVATTILSNYQADLKEVVNGEEAIEAFNQNTYDLVLMDVQMPVLNGIEATSIIRNTIKSTVPIIALTANAIKGESEKCLSVGMNDFIAKPFEEQELIRKIVNWLEKEENFSKNHITATIPLYDLTKLEQISEGDNIFIKKMISLFIEQMPVTMNEIKQAYDENNLDTVGTLIHRIKPAINNMGIKSLENKILKIESLTEKNIKTVELHSLINEAADIIKEVVHKLSSY